jgi:hypothetical protein
MSLPRRCLAPWLAALAAIAFAAPAPVAAAAKAPHAPAAQAPQVDPNSPAGTEYQLPVDRAREQAGGGSGGSTPTSGDRPLFGTGVRQKKTRAHGGRGSESDASTSTSSRGGAGTPKHSRGGAGMSTSMGEQPSLGASSPEILRSQAPAPDGGATQLLAIGAGGAGVLVLGGLAGLAWRRRAARG